MYKLKIIHYEIETVLMLVIIVINVIMQVCYGCWLISTFNYNKISEHIKVGLRFEDK
jgi:hypothetical protein